MSLDLDDAYRRQLGHWRAALHSGATRIGWKVGLNAPELQRRLGLERPAVGHLTSSTLVGADGSHSLAGAVTPVVEPEVAIEIGVDGAVVGLAAALEVVDLDPPLSADNAGDAIAANLFHRATVIRPSREATTTAGIIATCSGGREPRDPVDAAAVDIAGTVALVANTLGTLGESLQVGDRIIAGSLVPPVPVAPGDSFTLDLGDLGRAEVSFQE